jgi:hypothetical protein
MSPSKMRAFYLIYASDSDDVISEVETELGQFLTDVATSKGETQEFLDVVHSWDKHADWDWLTEMPRSNMARFAITGGFGGLPALVCSDLIKKINGQTGLENAARFYVCTVGTKENPLTPFSVPTYWELV